MILLRLAAVLSFFAGISAAQSLTISPNLRAGDRFTMEIVHSRQDSTRPQNNSKTRTLCEFQVEEASSQNGFLLDLVIGEGEVLESAQPVPAIVTQIAKAASSLHFKLRLNPGGDIRGVENETELRQRLTELLAQLKSAILSSIPEAQRATVEKALDPLMQPQLMMSQALNEVRIYFDLHGATFETGKPIEARIEQPNALNGAPMPMDVRLLLTGSDETSAQLTTQTKPEPKALQALTTQLMQQMVGANVTAPTLEMVDEGVYRYDRKTGLMSQVEFARTVQAGPQNRKDVWTLKLLQPPR